MTKEYLKTRKQYIRLEFESDRVFSTRKAMIKRCPLCGGWIDRTSLGSLLSEDLFPPLEGIDKTVLAQMWVELPYCTACLPVY